MRRSHPLSDHLPWEHRGQGLPYLSFPIHAMNLFGMHIFHQSPSSARYSFYQPMVGWKGESTCWQWCSNLPPLTQEPDALLTELTWPVITEGRKNLLKMFSANCWLAKKFNWRNNSKRDNRRFPYLSLHVLSTFTNNSFILLYLLKHVHEHSI